MNRSCRAIVPLLYRIAEGEARPDEAMRTARHLSDCTACRILLARERRLAAMLEEGLDDPLQVGEDFVREVMDTLPLEPPPAPRPEKRKRRLKLASLAAWFALIPLLALAAGAVDLPAGEMWQLIPELDAPAADGTAESAQRLGGLIVLALDRLASGLSFQGGLPVSILFAFVSLVSFGLCAALASASVLALAMGRALAPPSSGSA